MHTFDISLTWQWGLGSALWFASRNSSRGRLRVMICCSRSYPAHLDALVDCMGPRDLKQELKINPHKRKKERRGRGGGRHKVKERLVTYHHKGLARQIQTLQGRSLPGILELLWIFRQMELATHKQNPSPRKLRLYSKDMLMHVHTPKRTYIRAKPTSPYTCMSANTRGGKGHAHMWTWSPNKAFSQERQDWNLTILQLRGCKKLSTSLSRWGPKAGS